ncbi:MAG: diguanylate cyclase [Thiovulaceae bacterium]|nr:diguanylate cyclase [Sulfurimonadaceae bacterium]
MNTHTQEMRNTLYELQAKGMREDIKRMIEQKQKASLAIALSITNDKSLVELIKQKKIPSDYYSNLILMFQKETLYQNVWIQIVDKDTISLYRSWSPLKGDTLVDERDNLQNITSKKSVIYTINAGKFDLSLKSIVPIFDHDTLIGSLGVITHFNSISKDLKESDIDSVVLLKKEYKKNLIYPFTKMFLDDYYIANLDAPKELRDYLKDHGIEHYLNNSYKIENGYIIVSYELKNTHAKTLGYYIMSKKISDLPNLDLKYFNFKMIAFFVLFGLILLFIFSTTLLLKNRNQKKYYKNILDSSNNIVVINNGIKMLYVNNAFFRYFPTYKSLEEFKKDYECICDLFAKENGYLQAKVGDDYWVTYVINTPDKVHKAKIIFLGNTYFFTVTAALISKEENHYSIVLSDITKEENYQKELFNLSIKDTLTGINNRHFFDQKFQEEFSRAVRYKQPLSLIMLDIDFFKRVNDEHGHDVGDTVLIEYTKLISKILRKTDFFCRTGGEEFIIILPLVALAEAQKLAEKLRYEVEAAKKVVPITMSFGIAQYQKNDTIPLLLKRVDDALYKAKENGRNCVVIS